MVNYDWDEIKYRYMMGESPQAIAKSPQTPTRQAIKYRATKENWEQANDGKSLVRAETGELVPIDDPRKIVILKAIQDGCSYAVAAGKAGMSADTLRRWRKDDADFAALVTQARAKRLGDHEENIHKAGDKGDWKASAYMLERSPETRDQYRQQREGTAIQINIGTLNRDEVVIEG